MPSRTLRIGTRSSALARWQADWVATELRNRGHDVELVLISTRGDRNQTQAIGSIGGDGLFTKELQRSLLARDIDLAVHSLKDLPTELVVGLLLGAVPERGPTGDVLVSRTGDTFARLPPGARIGTGSLRRRAQLLHARPDLLMKDIRGNVDTRLRKLHAGDYDALVLAEAGLRRLALENEISEVLPQSVILPAVGQGALGIECREDDESTRMALAALDHPATHQSVTAERAMLMALAGGCLAPIAGWGRIVASGGLRLSGVVLSSDGRQRVLSDRETPGPQAHSQDIHLTGAEELGRQVASDLAAQGAIELIHAARTG
ncbi:MAG TPA: hydroxymethylbilane synthase [Pirellulales bacterium]